MSLLSIYQPWLDDEWMADARMFRFSPFILHQISELRCIFESLQWKWLSRPTSNLDQICSLCCNICVDSKQTLISDTLHRSRGSFLIAIWNVVLHLHLFISKNKRVFWRWVSFVAIGVFSFYPGSDHWNRNLETWALVKTRRSINIDLCACSCWFLR